MSSYNRDDYGPSSSPGSSPGLTPADSSPLSSPNLDPLHLDDEEQVDELPAATDPFSGSYTWRRAKRVKVDDSRGEGPSSVRETRATAAEDRIWADEGERAYEGCRMFRLEAKDLTRVDKQFIHDLKSMVVLPNLGAPQGEPSGSTAHARLAASATPAVAARQIRRTFSRHESKNSALIPGEKDENIHLYMAKNMITKLPRELWTLENLTTLSLRENRLTYLPPEIGNLKNLRNLNVSANMLRYLPSELDNLKLDHLAVNPNRYFLEPPPSGLPISEPIYVTPNPVPSLVELASRVLGSPPPLEMQAKYASMAMDSRTLRNVLEYYLPLGAEIQDLPGPLKRTLDACSPGCVPQSMLEDADEDEDESMQITSIGRCGNREHVSWFVRHAEERYTWVRAVAGQEAGGNVPLRWRGCSRGCLKFLEAVVRSEHKEKEKDVEEEVEFEVVTEQDRFRGPLTFFD